jgi:hypothetical protein
MYRYDAITIDTLKVEKLHLTAPCNIADAFRLPCAKTKTLLNRVPGTHDRRRFLLENE